MNLKYNEFFNNVVTKGDYAMVTGGANLIVGTRKSGKGLSFNVAPGQPVAFYVNAGVATTVDDSNLTADILKAGIHIGVGVDTDGDGLVDDIRLIGQDRTAGCYISEFRTIAPQCGVPEVKDLLFKDIKCDKTYSAMVTVDDNLTRSFAPWNKTELEFVGSTVYSCGTECDNCSEGTADSGEVACRLVDSLNEEFELKIFGEDYPDFKNRRRIPRPYRAVKLHSNSFVYCFTPTGSSCEGCTHIDAIPEIRVNDTVITLVGTTNPADSTQTLTAQLQLVAEQIEAAFEEEIGKHSGSAYVTGGYGKCCTVELHVNTCDDTFDLLDDQGADITPCDTSDPLAEVFTLEDNCVDCGDQAQTETYEAGIRVIAEQLKPECDVFLDKPLASYGRFLTVDAIGDGWECSKSRRRIAQAATSPVNFGGHVQWKEYQVPPGGRGREFSRGNNHQGWLGLPGKKARVRNAISHSECNTSYCEYVVEGYIPTKLADHQDSRMKYFSSVFIPQGDSTTTASFEQFLLAIETLNPGTCSSLNAVSCGGGDVVLPVV